MTGVEILIIGGGIAGASTAWHLATRGHQVTLLERGEIASEASGVNAGSITSLGWGHDPDLQSYLTAGSAEIFKHDPAGIEVNRAHAAEVLPFLRRVPIARTWAGLMPFSLDGKPIIGRLAGHASAWIVSGLASSGFGRGPMAGKLLAVYIHTGHRPHVLADADPARFASVR